MKKLFTFLLLSTLLIGCKDNSKNSESDKSAAVDSTSAVVPVTTKLANANGMEKFKELNELDFTFNVSVNGEVRSQRDWKWSPKTNKVTLSEKGETISYTKGESLDSTAMAADQKFINDTYWLLFPYQLMWSTYEFDPVQKATAPISNKEMQQLTIKYIGNGGYTPGDTYKLYFEDDLMIKEWTYISSDGRELTTTWEDYETFKGVPIAKMHKSADSTFQLYFTNIKVE